MIQTVPQEGIPAILVGLLAGDPTAAAGVDVKDPNGATPAGGLTGPAAVLATIMVEAYPADAGLAFRVQDALASISVGSGLMGDTQSLIGSVGGLLGAVVSMAVGRTGGQVEADLIALGRVLKWGPAQILAGVALAVALQRGLDAEDPTTAWSEAVTELGARVEHLAAIWPAHQETEWERAAVGVAHAIQGGGFGATEGEPGDSGQLLGNCVAQSRGTVRPGSRLATTWDSAQAAVAGALRAVWSGGISPAVSDGLLADVVQPWPFEAAPPVGATLEQWARGACRRGAGACRVTGYPPAAPPFVVHRLAPQILYGRNPLVRGEIAALAAAAVTDVLDLRQPHEWKRPGRIGREAIEACAELGVRRVSIPLEDGGVVPPEALSRAVAQVRQVVAAGRTLFVHCRAGRERTGAVLWAWHLSQDRAETDLFALAPHLGPTVEQRAGVLDWVRGRP